MNKIKFLLVFVAVLCFALVIPYLQSSFDHLTKDVAVREVDEGIRLLDPGYLMQLRIHSQGHDSHPLSIKGSTELDQKNNVEAENCLKVGLSFLEKRKLERAHKFLERAVVLARRMVEGLLALGEFLEHYSRDVVRADQHYVRALMVDPACPRARRNRARTKQAVAALDQDALETVAGQLAALSLVPPHSPALRRVEQEANVYHIHHTVALEGNTMTLEQVRDLLETGRSVEGKSFSEHAEVVGLDSAMRFINASLLHRVGDITLEDILDIHLRVLGHTDPTVAGQLRTTQVYVAKHVPPPPSQLQELMSQFLAWLNHPNSVAMHPIRYAALAHYHLVYIHPFLDGNGRTSRLLMNFLLMQAGYPPVIIRHHDRPAYYEALSIAQEGDTRPFVRFVNHCAEKTLDVYLWATAEDHAAIDGKHGPRSFDDTLAIEEMRSALQKRHSDVVKEVRSAAGNVVNATDVGGNKKDFQKYDDGTGNSDSDDVAYRRPETGKIPKMVDSRSLKKSSSTPNEVYAQYLEEHSEIRSDEILKTYTIDENNNLAPNTIYQEDLLDSHHEDTSIPHSPDSHNAYTSETSDPYSKPYPDETSEPYPEEPPYPTDEDLGILFRPPAREALQHNPWQWLAGYGQASYLGAYRPYHDQARGL